MNEDYDIDDVPCPACGNSVTHYRHCNEPYCEDGWIDLHEDDPINYGPGEECEECPQCHGHGIQRWCPKCGADYWLAKRRTTESASKGESQ